MTTHESSKQVKTFSGSFWLRAAGSALAFACLVALSACAVGGDDEVVDEETQLAQEQCELALEQFPDDELPYLSCMLQQPVDADGNTLADIEPGKQPASDSEYVEKACNTYYGTCTGASGCSRAVGEGWEVTYCGSWLYTWMTVCDGELSSYGTGFCLW